MFLFQLFVHDVSFPSMLRQNIGYIVGIFFIVDKPCSVSGCAGLFLGTEM